MFPPPFHWRKKSLLVRPLESHFLNNHAFFTPKYFFKDVFYCSFSYHSHLHLRVPTAGEDLLCMYVSIYIIFESPFFQARLTLALYYSWVGPNMRQRDNYGAKKKNKHIYMQGFLSLLSGDTQKKTPFF